MPPLLTPGPNPYGSPPILLAGVGPAMIEVAGEVADGFLIHPFHTEAYLDELAMPALRRGTAKSGRERAILKSPASFSSPPAATRRNWIRRSARCVPR